MSDTVNSNRSFLAISVVAILWNLLGVVAFIGMSMTPVEAISETYGQEFGEIFATKPVWVSGSFAIAVFAGLLGSIALLMKKKWATPLFIISLIGILIHNFWGISAGTLSVIGTFDKIMTVAVVVIAVFLIWYARKKTAQGVLR